MSKNIISHTVSLCPVCLRQVSARYMEKDGAVYLQKKCPEHGVMSVVVWRGKGFRDWCAGAPPAQTHDLPECPWECGLCSGHLQQTCCILLEVTNRCNMQCRFCFADAYPEEDAGTEQVKEWIKDIAERGLTFLQLSGGEPTLRDDLPELVAYAKENGIEYVQLNSNAVRLAEDEPYVRALGEAGLSFVFMQFDGTDDEVYKALRGRPMWEIKKKAIELCGKNRIGVTLVPTLVPGVNTDRIGDILRFAMEQSPVVRGVHFQPVTYLGRMPSLPNDEKRFTLPELLEQMEAQTDGLIKREYFVPSCCDHPLCGFHGDFVMMPEGLCALTPPQEEACCCGVGSADKNRNFIGRRWSRRGDECCDADPHSLEGFAERLKTHGFTITSMAFQDAHTIDLARLRQCSLHVYRDGRIVPFCSNYLTNLPCGSTQGHQHNHAH